MYRLFYLVVCLLFLGTSCVQLNYVKDVVPITQKHRIIAVLPPLTTIEEKLWMSTDKLDETTLKKQNELQMKLLKSFEHRLNNGSCFVEVLSMEQTNDKVLSLGYPQVSIDPSRLCKLLNVDAVIQCRIDIREPVNEMTALLLQNEGYLDLYTNTIVVRATLHDSLHTLPIWELNDSRYGYLGSIKLSMQQKAINRLSKNTPYNVRKNPFKKLYISYINRDTSLE